MKGKKCLITGEMCDSNTKCAHCEKYWEYVERLNEELEENRKDNGGYNR